MKGWRCIRIWATWPAKECTSAEEALTRGLHTIGAGGRTRLAVASGSGAWKEFRMLLGEGAVVVSAEGIRWAPGGPHEGEERTGHWWAMYHQYRIEKMLDGGPWARAGSGRRALGFVLTGRVLEKTHPGTGEIVRVRPGGERSGLSGIWLTPSEVLEWASENRPARRRRRRTRARC